MVYAFEVNPTTFPASRFFSIASIVNLVVPIAVLGAALIMLVLLMVSALNWITASGDPEKLNKARTKMRYTLLGFAIVIASYLIVRIVGYVLGIDFMI